MAIRPRRSHACPDDVDRAMLVKAQVAKDLGVVVNVCGTRGGGAAWATA